MDPTSVRWGSNKLYLKEKSTEEMGGKEDTDGLRALSGRPRSVSLRNKNHIPSQYLCSGIATKSGTTPIKHASPSGQPALRRYVLAASIAWVIPGASTNARTAWVLCQCATHIIPMVVFFRHGVVGRLHTN